MASSRFSVDTERQKAGPNASLLRLLLGFASLLLGTTILVACGNDSSSADTKPAESARESGSTSASADDSPQAASTNAPATAESRREARSIFEQRCVTCHGAKGEGDGPASAGLEPQPRNLSSASWQDEVSDEHIERIIVYGGAAVGRSPMMPGNPDLGSKKAVVAALREHIRNLRR